jgi:hypothetical protein
MTNRKWRLVVASALLVWAALAIPASVQWNSIPTWLNPWLETGAAVAFVAALWVIHEMPAIPTLAWAVPLGVFQFVLINGTEADTPIRIVGSIALVLALGALVMSRRVVNAWCGWIRHLTRTPLS